MKYAALILVFATAAHADPVDVTADQAVDLYRQHSPRLVAARAEVAVAQADVIGARIYPNPTLSVSQLKNVTGEATSGDTSTQVGIEIPLLVGHQRGRREKAAEASVAAARAGVAADQATAEADVRAKFVDLQAAQQKVVTLTAAVADAQVVRGIVAGRTSAGAASPYELERIDLAVASMTSELGDAKTEQALAAKDLAKAVGMSAWEPHAAGELAVGAQLAEAVDAAHPQLAQVRADEAAAVADEDRAKADAVPVPSLAINSYGTSGPWGAAITAGLEIPLPTFDRNQGAVAKARAEQNRARVELAARQHELAADLEAARTSVAHRKEVLAAFDAGALARLDKMRQMAETAYRSGQGGIVELLDAVESITEARLRHIDLLKAVVDAELAVRAATIGD